VCDSFKGNFKENWNWAKLIKKEQFLTEGTLRGKFKFPRCVVVSFANFLT
jgi:hypothetical protein